MSQEAKPSATVLSSSEGDLFGRTLRMALLLVGACVLFVGVLSVAAVMITSKAMGSSQGAAAQSEVNDTSRTASKKPLSI